MDTDTSNKSSFTENVRKGLQQISVEYNPEAAVIAYYGGKIHANIFGLCLIGKHGLYEAVGIVEKTKELQTYHPLYGLTKVQYDRIAILALLRTDVEDLLKNDPEVILKDFNEIKA